MNNIKELQEKLEKLHLIQIQLNKGQVIILQDTSNFSYNKKHLTGGFELIRATLDSIITQLTGGGNNRIVSFTYPELGFMGMYNFIRRNTYKEIFFTPTGIVTNGLMTKDNSLKTTDFEYLGININTLEDNELIIKYIEIKDVEEAIFNTRMAIYNLTHRNEDIERLHREIEMLKGKSKSKGQEECCDKLESRLDRLKINLSRVEGMVREIEVPRNTTLKVFPNRPRYYFSAPYLNSPRQSSSRPNSQTRRKPIPKHLFYSRPSPEFP